MSSDESNGLAPDSFKPDKPDTGEGLASIVGNEPRQWCGKTTIVSIALLGLAGLRRIRHDYQKSVGTN